jgi:hypothetical protein
MSPILGILASSRPAAVGDYESIATVTVGSGGSSSISFSSIPSTYQHLQIRALTGNATHPNNVANFTYNSDTTNANYRNHWLYGNGSSVFAGTDGNVRGNGLMGNSMSIGPSSWIVDILDYNNTNKNKTVRYLNGYDTNGGGGVWFASSLWMSTAAISNIEISTSAGSFAQYSSFALYGIKG